MTKPLYKNMRKRTCGATTCVNYIAMTLIKFPSVYIYILDYRSCLKKKVQHRMVFFVCLTDMAHWNSHGYL